MKSFLMLFISAIVLSLSSAHGQSLEFTKSPSGPVNFDIDVEVAKINLHVKNVSTSPVKVWVTMDTSNCSPKHRAYFCWEQCYSFGVVDPRNIAGGKPITLKPGQDTSAFSAYVDHYAITNNPEPGNSTLAFSFFNEDDPSDRLEISLVFNIGTSTSVLETKQSTNVLAYDGFNDKIVSDFPPGSGFITLISTEGKSYILNNSLSTSELPSGLYGYVFSTFSGNKSLGTIVISK